MALEHYIEALMYVVWGIPTTLSFALLAFLIGITLGSILLLVRFFMPKHLQWLTSA
jgi:polar amino acid transport system permease protein